jgi:hypothetical protein
MDFYKLSFVTVEFSRSNGKEFGCKVTCAERMLGVFGHSVVNHVISASLAPRRLFLPI